jgi:predicted transposase YdaD
MSIPLQFPDPLEEARQRAEEFQRLAPDTRLRQLLDTIETGMVLLRESKNRQTIDRLYLDRELQWQSVQRELFRRHAR